MLSSPLTAVPLIGSAHTSQTANNNNNSASHAASSSQSQGQNSITNRSLIQNLSQATKSIPNSSVLTTKKNSLDKTLINIGSRKSNLAIIQSEIVSNTIVSKFPQLKTKITSVTTLGDENPNRPLYSFGGKSLWTRELEMLLYEKIGNFEKIDLIVHSLKDMPTNLPDGFELGCILEREDPRDALVMKAGSPYKTLADLPDGSIVGTSSVRRSAQLLKNYPNLKFESVRGSVETRLRKLDAFDSQYSGILLAAAGLIRVDLGHRISQFLNEDIMYHAVGQGALGIEIRKDDSFMKQICNAIRDDSSMYCCLAERAMLRFLEGGCSVPIGVKTSYDKPSQTLSINAIVVSVDGSESVEQSIRGKVSSDEEADQLGCKLGELFLQNGAKAILDAIDYDRINELKQSGVSTPATNPQTPN